MLGRRNQVLANKTVEIAAEVISLVSDEDGSEDTPTIKNGKGKSEYNPSKSELQSAAGDDVKDLKQLKATMSKQKGQQRGTSEDPKKINNRSKKQAVEEEKSDSEEEDENQVRGRKVQKGKKTAPSKSGPK